MKLRRIVIITICFITFFYLAICCIVYFYQEKLLFFPEKLDKNFDYSLEGKFEEKFISTDGGGYINALHFKIPNPKGVILFLHGNAGSLRSWGAEGSYFNGIGYDCLMYDYRGFGKSEGPMNEKSFHNDAKAMYDHLKEFYSEKDILILGRSIGTGFATKLASETNPKLLILISPYYRLSDVARIHFFWLPVRLLLKYKLDTHIWMAKVKSPVLVIHGEKDDVIPYSHSLRLQKHIKPQHELISIKEGGHNDISFHNDYHHAMYKWLGK